MTVMLVKLIEDVIRVFHHICPCIFRKRHLLPLLRKVPRKGGLGDPIVYIYPNRHDGSGHTVYVKDASTGRKKRTELIIPDWILKNTFAVLKKMNELASKANQAATESRQQEDRVNKLNGQVKLIKKEVFAIRRDLKSIATHLRSSGRSSLMQ
jgi:hypothetical protein